MTPVFHEGLTIAKWKATPDDRKLLNIASEISRAKNWMEKNESAPARDSLHRAFELIDMTVETGVVSTSGFFIRELLRAREILAAIYVDGAKDARELKVLLRAFLDLQPSVHNLQLEF